MRKEKDRKKRRKEEGRKKTERKRWTKENIGKGRRRKRPGAQTSAKTDTYIKPFGAGRQRHPGSFFGSFTLPLHPPSAF